MEAARRKAGVWDRRNPFWRYAALQAGMLLLALIVVLVVIKPF